MRLNQECFLSIDTKRKFTILQIKKKVQYYRCSSIYIYNFQNVSTHQNGPKQQVLFIIVVSNDKMFHEVMNTLKKIKFLTNNIGGNSSNKLTLHVKPKMPQMLQNSLECFVFAFVPIVYQKLLLICSLMSRIFDRERGYKFPDRKITIFSNLWYKRGYMLKRAFLASQRIRIIYNN